MIGELHIEVKPSGSVPDLAHVEIWEGWGTIMKRCSGTIVMNKWAAQELARRVNREDQ